MYSLIVYFRLRRGYSGFGGEALVTARVFWIRRGGSGTRGAIRLFVGSRGGDPQQAPAWAAQVINTQEDK